MFRGEVKIRRAVEGDFEAIVGLMLRLKRLNEEFDPLYTVKENAEEEARETVSNSFKDENVLMLVAEVEGKVVGFIRVVVGKRLFYTPEREGVISDLYVLPAYRKKRVGKKLLDEASSILRDKGVNILAAEFPPHNTIAVNFYEGQGFKPLLNKFFKEL